MSRWFEKSLTWSQVIVLKQDYCVRFPCQFQVRHKYKYNYWSEWVTDDEVMLQVFWPVLTATWTLHWNRRKSTSTGSWRTSMAMPSSEEIMVKEPKPFLLLGLCHSNFLFVNLSLTEHEQEPIINKIPKKSVSWSCVFKTRMLWSLTYIYITKFCSVGLDFMKANRFLTLFWKCITILK